MARVVILGAGVMGSAMAMPLHAAGHDVDLVGTVLDDTIIQSVKGNGFHPKLNIAMPGRVTAHRFAELANTNPSDAALIILGVSSAGVDWALEQLAKTLTKPVPVLMITKGLRSANNGIAVFPKIVSAELERRLGFKVPVVAVGGPCIAAELAALRDTLVVITGDDPALLTRVTGLLKAPFYHARVSADVVGVEICAAFKNFFALGVGWAQGHFEKSAPLGNGAKMFNLASGLFAQSVRELQILTEVLGGKAETVQGLAGVGDLYVTCLAGRNSRMGRLLGLGLSYSRAKAEHMALETVEGAELALAIGPQLEAMWIDGRLPVHRMPLSTTIVQTVCHDHPMDIPWDQFAR